MDKNTKATLAAGAAAGYVIGRTKKGKFALSLLSVVVGRSLDPMALVGQGVRKLAANPQFEQLGDQLRGQLLDSGRSAVSGMTSRGVESLTSALQQRTRSLLDSEEDAEDEEAADDEEPAEAEEAEDQDEDQDDEAADEEDDAADDQDDEPADEEEEEEEEEDEEPPPRRPAKKTARKRAAPAKKAPGKPPARKTAAKKTAKKPPARTGKRR